MLNNKHTGVIIGIITTFALCLCLAAVVFADYLPTSEQSGKSQEYETALFDTEQPLEINIKISESDWQNMLENATDEEYYSCDVEVNGETFANVGIRPKGNTSLTNIASDPDTDRYSFKLEFDKYTDGQNCYGLDKLVLNNNYADATNMKEAIVYDMFQFLDADASLYNYAAVYVNGEYWGVYLALEAVEESFIERNYGSLDGKLYKPEGMDMGNMSNMFEKNDKSPNMPQPGDTKSNDTGKENNQSGEQNNLPDPSDFNPQNGGNTPNTDEYSDENNSAEKQNLRPANADENNNAEQAANGNPPDFGGGFGGSASGGADLNYTDDDIDSYSTIWDGAVTETTEKDHKKVVEALQNISENNNIEEYLDIDNVLKYMAVHTFVVNLDSLSGNMAHNYYLYEEDGKLNIIPWDYNLAFGGMGGMSMGGDSDSASSTINFAIDTPFSGTEFFDALLENEEYKAIYHSYLQKLAEEYVNGGGFDKVYNQIRSQINNLVATDPTAFYTYEEFTDAADMLYQTVKLRAESVLGQLNGTVPSTKEAQEAQSDALIDSSEIDLSVMGQMNGGGNGGDFPDRDLQSEKTNAQQSDETQDESQADENFENADGSAKPPSTPNASQNNNKDFGNKNSDNNFNDENSNQENSNQENSDNGNSDNGNFDKNFSNNPNNAPPNTSQTANRFKTNLFEYGLCLLLLFGAIIFSKIYGGRKKSNK